MTIVMFVIRRINTGLGTRRESGILFVSFLNPTGMGLDGNAILLGNCITTTSCIEYLLLQKQASHEHHSFFLYTSLVCVYELAHLKQRTLRIECVAFALGPN
ncbi:hypothetical protein J3458_001103 [Metarhizium acridum]|uniref:uncharacterized protein n=1 Tax=Metarhizium acridum TaxID=92637 RepID=UPI001C6D0601|nr:hypothetical protein J3458_001103 [Metarhizium acridum]